MAFFNWSDTYSVGIKEFDEHHKKLIDMLNQLYDAMKAAQGNDVLGKILGDLIAYTKFHFQAEERQMQKHAYPGFAEHKKEHEALTRRAVELEQQFKSGKTTLTLSVGNFLKEWLTNHIQGSDKKYSPYLNGKS